MLPLKCLEVCDIHYIFLVLDEHELRGFKLKLNMVKDKPATFQSLKIIAILQPMSSVNGV